MKINETTIIRIIFSIVMVGAVFAALVLNTPPHIEIVLKDARDSITIEAGSEEELKIPKATGYYSDFFTRHGKNVKVKTENNVDTKKVGDYEIKYTAVEGKYKSERIIKVKVVDTLAPVITLNDYGRNFSNKYLSYQEEGYTAIDQCEGDITDRVERVVTNNLVTYTVKDSAGNEASATREIRYIEEIQPNGKVIYLTFDDGPSGYTYELLNILDTYGVKATFFVTGYGDSSVIGEIARRGHSVGVHTLTHDYAIYSSEEAFFSDIEAMNDIIEAQTGKRSNILRFPGGSSNTISMNYCEGIMSKLVVDVQARGYSYFDWNVGSGDTGLTTDTNTVASYVINGCSSKDCSMVLQHDIKGYSVAAVSQIIAWGLGNGYTFLPIDQSSPGMHQAVAN